MCNVYTSVANTLRNDFASYLANKGKSLASDNIPAQVKGSTLPQNIQLLSQALEDGEITNDEVETIKRNLTEIALKTVDPSNQISAKGQIRSAISDTIDEIIGKDLSEKLRSSSHNAVCISFDKFDLSTGNAHGSISAKFSEKIGSATLTADASATGTVGGTTRADQAQANASVKGESYNIDISVNKDQIKSTVSFGKGDLKVEAEANSQTGGRINATIGPVRATGDTQGNVSVGAEIGALRTFIEGNIQKKNGGLSIDIKSKKDLLIKAGATITQTSVNGQLSYSVSFASGARFSLDARGNITAGNKLFTSNAELALRIKLDSSGTTLKIAAGVSTSIPINPRDTDKQDKPATLVGVTAELQY